MTPEPGICTVDTCDTPTELYLCNTCVQELRDDWTKIPDLLPTLKAISRGEDVAFGLPTAEKRGGGAGSKPPMNLGALQLAADLEHAHTVTPEELAQTPEAAKRKTRWHTWIERADLMVNGEKETGNTEEYNKLRVKAVGLETEKKPQEVVDYLQEQAGINDLTADTIRQWKRRGNIDEYTIKEIWIHYDKKRKNVV